MAEWLVALGKIKPSAPHLLSPDQLMINEEDHGYNTDSSQEVSQPPPGQHPSTLPGHSRMVCFFVFVSWVFLGKTIRECAL